MESKYYFSFKRLYKTKGYINGKVPKMIEISKYKELI